jgi:hypothetical protein
LIGAYVTLEHCTVANNLASRDFVDAVRELERTLNLTSMFGDWKAVIVNEAHAIPSSTVRGKKGGFWGLRAESLH